MNPGLVSSAGRGRGIPLLVHHEYMRESGEPTWRLVLLAAQHLDAVAGEFRQDLVAEVQRMGPARVRGTIQPSSRA